jgi:glycogen debranching enzyme
VDTILARTGEGERPSPFAIPATDKTPSYRPRVLKHGNTFLVVDPYGDAQARDSAAEGLFHADTRYLSHLYLTVNGHRPLLLGSNVTEDNLALVIDLTNPDIVGHNQPTLAKETLHILRTKVLDDASCLETVLVRNYGEAPTHVELALRLQADFADIFEVRGQVRPRRGLYQPAAAHGSECIWRYEGLDRVQRECIVRFESRPDLLTGDAAVFRFPLGAGESRTVEFAVLCRPEPAAPAMRPDFAQSVEAAQRRLEEHKVMRADLHSSNPSFNDWLGRSTADIEMLLTDLDTGPYPYAGIPWFSTAFGRDAIITALECLWWAPYIARGTLRFLAATQATSLIPESDAEPGKILHETRKGEMAALGEVPFALYYGSVDSTPLFIVLARAYFDRTGDQALIAELWPHIEAAIGWMETYGDLDGDGFLEYDRKSKIGLTNQGWKDSADSIFHADGRLADTPIALCEVQAYAYAAWLGAATLARALGKNERANAMTTKAIALRRKFEATFWCEEIGTYAIALDGRKAPCRVRSSNAGQTLFTGIAAPERAARVAATLMDRSSFSSWGIRTVAEGEARYNPMSYHNGSIWPHDNALIAMGFARYGFVEPLLRLATGMFDAAMVLDLQRLPELFCGFERRPGQGPTGYPVACIPQAWASATVFAFLGALLGLSFNHQQRQIRLTRPVLPAFLNEIVIRNLRLGDSAVDLLFRRHTRDVALNVLRKDGKVEVIIVG